MVGGDVRPHVQESTLGPEALLETWASTRCLRAHAQPVRALRHEHVLAGLARERPELPTDRVVTPEGLTGPAVAPDHEEGRSRAVLPAQHQVRAQLAEAEVGAA